MSRSAHAQSTYKLHRLPMCSRCRQEFQLVLASYELPTGGSQLVEEWECSKCGKTVPKSSLREEPLSPQDKVLSDWCKNEAKERQRRKKREKRSGY